MNEQNEKKEKNKKEIVKNILIIFLIIMLILTFFSNTIMNYSLPEVSTAYAGEGSVTSKVRGSGVVETAEDYEVRVTDNRVISSVKISVGDEVEEGDLLFELEDSLTGAGATLPGSEVAIGGSNTGSDDEESDALKTAQETLDQLELEYNKALLELSPSYALDSLNIKNAREDLDLAIKAQELSRSKAGVQASETEAKKQVEKLEGEIQELEDQALTVSGNSLKKIDKKLTEKRVKLTEAQSLADSLSKQLETIPDPATADDDVRTKQRALDELLVNFSDKKREDGSKNGQSRLDLNAMRKKVEDQRKVVEKIKSGKADRFEIRAKNAGVIKSINCIAGDTVTADSPLATIAVTGNGYSVKFSVTKEQAKLVRQGQEAQILNIWGDDITATLNAIKPDLENPNNSKTLEFSIKGTDVTVGQNLELSVGEKSAPYDVVVPNSAIRKDNDGAYVLVVNVKASPLGNRYVLAREDVEVLATDDNNSAVSGGLTGYEYVVTNSTKPLESGMKVRLADN